MALTVKAVNDALKARSLDIELQKGKGYFYFVGAPVEKLKSASVPIFSLSTLTLEQWVAEGERLIEEQKAQL